MKCSNCGMELEEGAVFCPYCGSKAEEHAVTSEAVPEETLAAEEPASVTEEPVKEQAAPAAEEPAPAAEEPVEEQAAPVAEETSVAEEKVPEQPETSFVAPDPVVGDGADPKKKKSGAVVIGIVIALLVVVVIVLFVLLGGNLFSGKKDSFAGANYLTYVKDDMVYQMDKDKKKPIQLEQIARGTENEDIYDYSDYWNPSTYNYDYHFYYTEDGNGLYFILDDDLYFKNLKKPDAEAERIDKNVSEFYMVDADTYAYVKGDDRRLYVSQKGNAEKVDKDVSWDIRFTDDKKGIFYNKLNDDYTSDCYYMTLKDLEPERVLKNVDTYTMGDLNTIIYKKDDVLHVLKNLTDDEKITSDCVDYSTYYDENGNLHAIYVVGDGNGEIPLYDFVNDDLAVEDAKIQEPQIEDYTTVEQVEDWWGDVYDREVTDYDAYDAAMDVYNEKDDRDYYRESLKEDSVELSQGTLYTYDTKSGEATELMQAYFDGDITYPMVSYVDPENLPSYKFSELVEQDRVWDLYYEIYDDLNQYEKYVLVDGTNTVELDIDNEEYRGAYIYNYDDNQTAVLCMIQANPDEEYDELYTLASINLTGKNAGQYTVIDSDVDFYCLSYMDDKGKNVYYVKDYDGETGDVYRDGEKVAKNVSGILDEVNGKLLYAGEKDRDNYEYELYLGDERIARDAGYPWSDYYYYVTEKGDVYYATDIDMDDGVCTYTVNYYNGKESTVVAEDVAFFLVMDDSHIFYLTDYSSRRYKGTLMFYNGKKATQIDEDVVAISSYY